MEIIPVTFATICVPTGMLVLLENSKEAGGGNQTIFWFGVAFVILGFIAIFWANWLVYKRRREEINRNCEESLARADEKLARARELELFRLMLIELRSLSTNRREATNDRGKDNPARRE